MLARHLTTFYSEAEWTDPYEQALEVVSGVKGGPGDFGLVLLSLLCWYG